jgi:esterase/lipase superfamily enzyme
MGPLGEHTITRRLTLSTLVLALAACSGKRELMPAPNLYNQPGAPALFNDIDPALQTSDIDLLYVTDRRSEVDGNGDFGYGYGRSRSLAFGSTTVSIQPSLPWADLVAASLRTDRDPALSIGVTAIEEQGRFPATPLPATVDETGVVIREDSLLAQRAAEDAFRSELRRRLARAKRKEVMVFVHGFNNTFEDAAEVLAELWHFLGRENVPLLYTWPAGKGGATGYTYDRESGEFTNFHLKTILALIAEMEDVEQIELVAHSRGTDVLSTAVRELIMISRGGGLDPLEEYRFENVILAAPDLDMDVFSQRFIAEYVGTGVGELTIYTAEDDRAINLSERLFKSRQRMGRLTTESLDPENAKMLEQVQGVSFVQLEEVEDRTGHGYFHNSPEASSDLILTLRFDRKPGSEHGRPMESVGPRFWLIKPGYPGVAGAPD